MSKYWVVRSLFFHIQSKYEKILTRKNSVFGQFYAALEQISLKMTPLDHLSLYWYENEAFSGEVTLETYLTIDMKMKHFQEKLL